MKYPKKIGGELERRSYQGNAVVKISLARYFYALQRAQNEITGRFSADELRVLHRMYGLMGRSRLFRNMESGGDAEQIITVVERAGDGMFDGVDKYNLVLKLRILTPIQHIALLDRIERENGGIN